MLDGEENLCGFGFEVVEDVEGGCGSWDVVIRPRDNKCEKIFLPKTKEEFVETAGKLWIEWELDEVISVEEVGNGRPYCTRVSALEIIRIEINGKMINLGKVDVLG